MSDRTHGRRLQALCVAVAIIGSACSGPQSSLEIGLKEFPSDIVLASGKSDAPTALVPPMPLQLVGPSSYTPLASPTNGPAAPTTTVARRADCPTADAFAVPKLTATSTVTTPPAERQYAYRNAGEFEIGGANAQKGTYPLESLRSINKVESHTSPTGTGPYFTYEITVLLGDTITITTYELVPEAAGQADPRLSPGLYVSDMITKSRDGTVLATFTPSPPMLLMPFPAIPGTRFRVTSTDGSTTMAYAGIVSKKTRVDACGVVLDAIGVRLDGRVSLDQVCPAGGNCVDPGTQKQCSPEAATPPGGPSTPTTTCANTTPVTSIANTGGGTSSSPDGQTNFVADYAFAPQYGGISVQDSIAMTGTEGGAPVSRTNTATITTEPIPVQL